MNIPNPNILTAVIMRGKNNKISDIIARHSDGASHVGMVVPSWAVIEAGKLLGNSVARVVRDWYIMESTTLNDGIDVLTGNRISGVSIVPYESRIKEYEGNVWLRELRHNVEPTRIDGELVSWSLDAPRLINFIADYHARPYEKCLGRLIGAVLDLPVIDRWFHEGDDSSIFCSELVAMCLQNQGFLENKNSAEEAHPGDWLRNPNSTLNRIDGNKFKHGYCYGPVQEVK